MSQIRAGDRDHARNTILQSLSSHRRRRIVSILNDEDAPILERDLATHLVALEHEKAPAAVTEDERHPVLVALVHKDLPLLEDAGLIDWSREDGCVTPTDHPALRTSKLDQPADVSADEWSAVLEALANDRRRTVLSVLTQESTPLDARALASRVGAREADVSVPEVPDETVDSILTTLHHVHLPVLADAGLVECDTEQKLVVSEDHPGVDEERLDLEPDVAASSIVLVAQL